MWLRRLLTGDSVCVCVVCASARDEGENEIVDIETGVCAFWKPGRAYGRALGVPICHTSGQLTWGPLRVPPYTGFDIKMFAHHQLPSARTLK